MQEDKSFLGTQPIKKLLPKLAVPTVIAQLVNMLYNIVDRIYIGHIPEVGSLALTGIGVCMPLILIVSAFSAFVASGGAPRASIFMGRGDCDSAERTLGGCLTMQVIISLLLTAAMLIWKDELLYLFGASENTIYYAADYMGIYALGTIFVQITLGLERIHNRAGLCKGRHENGDNRRCAQHCARPGVHIRAGHGRKGRCARDDHIAGGILRVGHLVSLRRQDRFAA